MKISPRECRTRGVPPVLMQHVDDLIAPESKVRLVQPLPRRVTVVPEMCYNMNSNERCKRRSDELRVSVLSDRYGEAFLVVSVYSSTC